MLLPANHSRRGPSAILLWFRLAYASAVHIQNGKYPELKMDDIYDNIKAFDISDSEALSKETGCASGTTSMPTYLLELLVTHMARYIVNILTKAAENRCFNRYLITI